MQKSCKATLSGHTLYGPLHGGFMSPHWRRISSTENRPVATLVGAGPAGLAPLIWAARTGVLESLAARGLVVVERAPTIGAGSLGDYAVGSDTLAETFLECLGDGVEGRLQALAQHESAKLIASFRGGAAPLSVVGRFLRVLGSTMREVLTSHGVRILTRHSAIASRRLSDGGWCTNLIDSDGRHQEIVSTNLVLATGAAQGMETIEREEIGNVPMLPFLSDKMMLSGDVLSHGGAARVAAKLAHRPAPKVAVIGGSHSAVTCANMLLNTGGAFAEQSVSLLHRRSLPLFYPSVEAARADGYADFTEDDVCPLTGRVFRLAGFHFEARALVRRTLAVGDAAPEPRLRLHRLAALGNDEEAWRILNEADLVIAALGYRPRALDLTDSNSEEIKLAAHARPRAPLVDRRCRVLDQRLQPIAGLFGIGLAAGFVPSGDLGGEPSFMGQANGLWLWQNDIGAMIVSSLLGSEAADVAA